MVAAPLVDNVTRLAIREVTTLGLGIVVLERLFPKYLLQFKRLVHVYVVGY